MKTNKHLEFQFHPNLNQAYLSCFYQGDIEYAREMFAIFLEDGLATATSLEQSLRRSDRRAVARAIHKLKPALAMVGLTIHARQMEELDVMIKQGEDLAAIGPKARQCVQGIQQQAPVLRREIERMAHVLRAEILD